MSKETTNPEKKENTNIDDSTQELNKSVEEDKAQALNEAGDYLNKAINTLEEFGLVKSKEETPEPEATPEPETSDSSDEEPYTEDDLAKSHADAPTVEDVEEGRVDASEFLRKSMDRIEAIEMAVFKLSKGVSTLCDELAKSHDDTNSRLEKSEKAILALHESEKALLKSSKEIRDYFFEDSMKVASEPKMAGNESTLAKSKDENPETEAKEPVELDAIMKDKLYKACFVERTVSYEDYIKAKQTGEMPKGLN